MTTTAIRTDIHRPSAEEFDPEQYEFVGAFDLHPRYGSPRRTEIVNAEVAKGHRFAAHQKSSQCGHCGASLRYAALLLHVTGEMIYVGETCLDGRFAGTKAQFDALRKASKALRDREKRASQFETALDDAVLRDWRLEVLGHEDAVLGLPEEVRGFALSVRSSMVKKNLSDRQVSALSEALDRARGREDARREREALYAKERNESIPVPEGKTFVTGVIRSTKSAPNYYGYGAPDLYKMTVRDERGFTVHGTVPSALFRLAETDLRGMRGMAVSFHAKLTRSNHDETFGFFSRPTQMVLIGSEVDAEGEE